VFNEVVDLSTQTIDLNGMFTSDVYSTGTFDLRGIESTALGMLLDALPIPVCLIDQWHIVVFCNQAWKKMLSAHAKMDGESFFDLLPRPEDACKAKRLLDKAEALLKRAFETRKPQHAEAILEIDHRRVWCRLHLRAVKVVSQRHLLVLIQDITGERTRQCLAQREEQRLRESLDDLEKRLKGLSAQMQDVRAALGQTTVKQEGNGICTDADQEAPVP
jgi:PAS domain-containing protein